MIIFSTVRSGSTGFHNSLIKKFPNHKDFREILHLNIVNEYLSYSGQKMCRVQSNHLIKFESYLPQLFKDDHTYILCPREKYVDQYLSLILVISSKYNGRWSITDDLHLFDNIIISYEESLQSIENMSNWLNAWALFMPKIICYGKYNIHRFEDFTKDTDDGKFWSGIKEKLLHIERPNEVINAIHESYKQWNLDVVLNGTKELLASTPHHTLEF